MAPVIAVAAKTNKEVLEKKCWRSVEEVPEKGWRLVGEVVEEQWRSIVGFNKKEELLFCLGHFSFDWGTSFFIGAPPE